MEEVWALYIKNHHSVVTVSIAGWNLCIFQNSISVTSVSICPPDSWTPFPKLLVLIWGLGQPISQHQLKIPLHDASTSIKWKWISFNWGNSTMIYGASTARYELGIVEETKIVHLSLNTLIKWSQIKDYIRIQCVVSKSEWHRQWILETPLFCFIFSL